jgi:hypothetical protein
VNAPDTAAFPRCGAFAITTNAPRRLRCATCFETHCATAKFSPSPTVLVDFRRLLRSRFAGLGTRKWRPVPGFRGSGGQRIRHDRCYQGMAA